jgi:transposase InsO family protein
MVDAQDPWQEEEHVRRLRDLCGSRVVLPDERGRGPRFQLPERRREQALRSNVARIADDLRRDGRSCLEIGDRLGLSTRTLRSWRADRRNTLRYRRVLRLRYHHAPRILRWQTLGAVWAMDYSKAPAKIDGIYPYLLAVRDLASGMQLLWLPVESPNADHALRALRSLFALHGAPLVLKTDNGSPFIADSTEQFLAQSEVKSLFSPPRMPRYNGAAEAGIGSLKTRTERHAERADRPGSWTLDDVAYAQAEANATARPRGDDGPTPDELWLARPALSRGDRDAFLATVTAITEEIGRRDGAPLAADLTTTQKRAVGREAARRALVEHGHLLFRRRRIPLTVDAAKVANNR